MLFVNSARALFTLAVISASTPAFIALIVPLSGVYYWVQRYYLRTSRELKRLDSVSRSPIYAHFQESLGGITTIRAYRQQQRFAMENEWRVDANLRAYFPSINANRYLAFTPLNFDSCTDTPKMASCPTRVPRLNNHHLCCRLRHYFRIHRVKPICRPCRSSHVLCPPNHPIPKLDCPPNSRSRNQHRVRRTSPRIRSLTI